jgi:hypothetical protein
MCQSRLAAIVYVREPGGAKPMSKMTDLIQHFVEAQSKVMIGIPDAGFALCRVESLVDDVVTVVPDGKPKVVMHYTQFTVRA